MRVLFVLADPLMWEHMGVMSLSAALRAQGHETRLVFAGRTRPADLDALVRAFAPRVIAYSASTPDHARLLAVNRRLRWRFEFTAVFGGPHPTFFPEVVDDPGVDVVVVGEADGAFPDLCRRIEDGGDVAGMPNTVVRRGGERLAGPLSPLIEDLDSLPMPDRALMYDADPGRGRDGIKAFLTSRGCPHACTYCFNHSYNELYRGLGPVVRVRSPEHVIAEIAAVRERYPLEYLAFVDDTFLLRPEGWIERFCDLYEREVGLPFGTNVRANLVTRDVLVRLRQAGLYSVGMGVECGDEALCRGLLGRHMGVRRVVEAADLINELGIKLVTQSMLGLPVDDPFQVDLRTLDLNIRLAPTLALPSLLFPFPGTAIERHARAAGFLAPGDRPRLDTIRRHSPLRFADAAERRRIENLHKLFPVVARLPSLRPHVETLVDLPLDDLYTWMFYLWYGAVFRFEVYPFTAPLRQIGAYLELFGRMVRKS